MQFIIGVLVGLFIGGLLVIGIYKSITSKVETSGTFVIDFSDPLKDVCRLELDSSLDDLYTKKQMVLAIKTYGENSPN